MSSKSQQGGASNNGNQALMPQAVELHGAGLLDQAAQIYKEILAGSPRDFDANHLLGVVALQQGQLDTATGLLELALSIRPRDPAAMGNLGITYLRTGKTAQAHELFQDALKLQPNSPVALSNAATGLHDLGRYSEALLLARKACKLDPDAYDPCNLLGTCLLKAGEDRAAVDMLEAATRLQPNRVEAWANLSIALRSIGEEDLADKYADKAASLKPDSSEALVALAAAQQDQGRFAEAIESYRKLLLMGTPSADVRAAYAHALLVNERNDEAIEQLQRAIALKDKDLAIRWTLVMAPLRTVYESESARAASREAFAKGLRDVKEWYEHTSGIESAFKAVGMIQPFLLAYHPYNNRELLSRYGELCTTFMSTLPAPAGTTIKTKRVSAQGSIAGGERKLRLGVVSAHVRNHSVWNAVTKGWLQNLDRNRFEVYLFHLDATADAETSEAREFVVQFEDRPRDLSGWIQSIKGAELDAILYPEIGMHPLTLKLACLRLAPVQATSFGQPETSGLPTIDLYFSAAALEPAGAASNYTERLVTLPNLGVCVERLAPEIRTPNLRALRLPSDEPLLLCPGTPYKYAPEHDQVWVQIARQLGRRTLFRRSAGGRLVFFRIHGEERNKLLINRLRAAFDAGGLDFDSHVCFVRALERPDYFGLMRQSAVMLDTLGFSGLNTAIQAIECGLPVLAFEGEFMRGRFASGILRQLDLPELVATSPAEFVQKAVELAKDAERRKALQAKLIERRERLFHDLTPVRALESSLLEAVENARSLNSQQR
jgi:protein O-GlcNAc transferase